MILLVILCLTLNVVKVPYIKDFCSIKNTLKNYGSVSWIVFVSRLWKWDWLDNITKMWKRWEHFLSSETHIIRKWGIVIFKKAFHVQIVKSVIFYTLEKICARWRWFCQSFMLFKSRLKWVASSLFLKIQKYI